jgi:phosphoserine phosphatase RsbU/P
MKKEKSLGLIRGTVCLLFLATGSGLGFSQTPAAMGNASPTSFDATRLWQPTGVGGTWLVHAGDDPSFSDPQLDDSHWMPFDVSTSLHSVLPGSNPGVVWYRMHVSVAPDEAGLAVEAISVSNAFIVYANGVELLRAGQFAPYIPYHTGPPLIAQVPAGQVAARSIVIAVRAHIDDKEWKEKYPALYSGNIVLGRQDDLVNRQWFRVMGPRAALPFELSLVAILSIAGFILYSAERNRKEYLWLSLFALSECLLQFCLIYMSFYAYTDTFVRLRAIPQFGIFWFPFPMYFAFVRQRMRPLLTAEIVVCCVSAALIQQPGLSQALSFYLTVPANLLVVILIPAVLIIHWRRGNREAGILLIPVALSSVTLLSLGIGIFRQTLGNSYTKWLTTLPVVHFGGFVIDGYDLVDILSWLSLGLIILLRSNRMSREAAAHEGQLAAAREVQQILVPERTEAIPGFAVDSSYLPAQQVGGDFFQVVPVEDNGVLIVVGDVAGKGLPAAMMVSVLVGAIRTLAAFTHDPAEVLAQLNERLVGRTGGGVYTAIATYIAADGAMNIANAGHLNPYIDGQELDFPGALPLGMLAGTTYETSSFMLGSGSRLTFYSDGVIEAQNAKGDLLGFERGRELSTESADAIVEAAQKFGQSDDITVVAIVRE